MSVQSEIERINTEVAAQTGLIGDIAAALQAKAQSAPILQIKTVTATASGLTVTPDEDYDGLGAVSVSGDADLVPENIKEGVEIFGVTGTLASGNVPGLTFGTATLRQSDYDDELCFTIPGVSEVPRMIYYSLNKDVEGFPVEFLYFLGTEIGSTGLGDYWADDVYMTGDGCEVLFYALPEDVGNTVWYAYNTSLDEAY